ncbi:MAG: hypothetical protein ACLT38_09290 [Akkermansia sp.]
MTPTKGDVKNWLKAIGKDRDWLARECGTEKGTVNNWLSPSGPFPSNAILKIHSLMSQYGPAQPENEAIQTNRLVLEITEERMRKYERAASEKGVPLRQWLTDGGPGGGRAPAAANALPRFPWSDNFRPMLDTPGVNTVRNNGNIAAGSLRKATPSHLPFTWKALQKRIWSAKEIHGTPHPGRLPGNYAAPHRPAHPQTGNHVEYNDGRGVT